MFMDLQPLRAFLAVARGGGYAKAAEALHRTQPAVTAAVQSLERELRRRLFERRGRRAVLSPAGRALLAEAGPLLDQWEKVPDRLAERLEGGFRGELRIGAGESATLYVLPALLGDFQRKHPEVRLVIHHQRADETLRMLRSGELDFGVRPLTTVPEWAHYRPFRSYKRLAVCAQKHPFGRSRGPVTLRQMAEHPLLVPGSQSITRILMEGALSRAGLAYRVGLEAGGWEAIKTYAAAGLGVALVPDVCLVPADRRRLAVRDASALFGEDAQGIVTRRGTLLSNSAQAVIRALDPHFPFNEDPRGEKLLK